jgi:hypothetical protein
VTRQYVSIFVLAQLKLLINKNLTFRTHHYCLTNHITIETDHKEFPPYISTIVVYFEKDGIFFSQWIHAVPYTIVVSILIYKLKQKLHYNIKHLFILKVVYHTLSVSVSFWWLQGMELYIASPFTSSKDPNCRSRSSNMGIILPSVVGPTYICFHHNFQNKSLLLWVGISIRTRCTQLCDKVCQWLVTGRCFFPGPLVSSTNKSSRLNITYYNATFVLAYILIC